MVVHVQHHGDDNSYTTNKHNMKNEIKYTKSKDVLKAHLMLRVRNVFFTQGRRFVHRLETVGNNNQF